MWDRAIAQLKAAVKALGRWVILPWAVLGVLLVVAALVKDFSFEIALLIGVSLLAGVVSTLGSRHEKQVIKNLPARIQPLPTSQVGHQVVLTGTVGPLPPRTNLWLAVIDPASRLHP
jgi:hypothetical protein